MIKKEDFFLACLVSFPSLGPKRLAKIRPAFDSWQETFGASLGKLLNAGLEETVANNFILWRRSFSADAFATTLEKENISLVSLEDDEYPELLKNTFDPPPVIFYRGEMRPKETLLAIVGSRKCTPYGERIVKETVPKLVEAGVAIASGLALGIDAIAHAATLEAGGRTVAVLGSGIDKKSIYPEKNQDLAERIIDEGGCLMSEFPPEAEPLKGNFPRRNRIISGMSKGVFVVEAAERSGSLITARYALEEGRDVLASPGSVFSWQSQGPNKLIKQGAKVVITPSDALEAIGMEPTEKSEKRAKSDWSGMNENERIILMNLSSDPISINDLVIRSKLDIRIINSTLTILEIKKLAKNIGGGNYVLI